MYFRKLPPPFLSPTFYYVLLTPKSFRSAHIPNWILWWNTAGHSKLPTIHNWFRRTPIINPRWSFIVHLAYEMAWLGLVSSRCPDLERFRTGIVSSTRTEISQFLACTAPVLIVKYGETNRDLGLKKPGLTHAHARTHYTHRHAHKHTQRQAFQKLLVQSTSKPSDHRHTHIIIFNKIVKLKRKTGVGGY